MIYEIKNDILRVGINSFGVEFDYIIKDNINRLHKRNETYQKQSPLLFPFIGKTENDFYYYNNKKYIMDQIHGFAPYNEFKVIKHEENYIEFSLEDSVETLSKYPFKFELIISYSIKDNVITTNGYVLNKDNKQMLFNIGYHPVFTFNYPNTNHLNSKIVFDEEIDVEFFEVKNSQIGNLINLGKANEINMSTLIQKYHTIIFKNMNNATLKTPNNSVRIDTDAPYFTFWHQGVENPEFICLEPWYGLPEEIAYDKNLENKKGIIKLNPNETHKSFYTITID